MAQMYTQRRRAAAESVGAERMPESAGGLPPEVLAGRAAPGPELMGSRADLPEAVRSKMESSFGADFSGVQLYESQAVADAGAQAVAMGNRIAFAPGELDFSSTVGQALLGHELSHVVSQARGEVSGEGFLNDHALEARADREGAMAAAGESVYAGPVTPVSASSVSAAAGPMQAKKPGSKKLDESLEISEPTLVTGEILDKEAKTDTGDATVRSFQNGRSYALNQMLQNASREQLQDPKLRQLVLDDYNTNMNARLRSMEGIAKDEMDSKAFRRGAGELHSLNMVLGSMLPEDFSDQVMAAQKQGGESGAMDYISSSVSSNSELMDFMGGLAPSFAGVSNYADEGERSAMMMNNLLLRSVNGAVAKKYGMAQRARASELKKQGKTNQEIEDDLSRTVDKGDVVRSMKLQKAINTGNSDSASRLRRLLVGRLGG